MESVPLGADEFEFSFAFQPIVDVIARRVISFEALVRGPLGEAATEVFARVSPEDLPAFDQACRLKAIRLAARLNLDVSLNLNFLPNCAQPSGDSLRATLEASLEAGIPAQRLVFELTEKEYLQHGGAMNDVLEQYSAFGFQTAIDDFGTGFSGLRRLAEHQPDYVKLDRNLVANIHEHRVKQVIVRGIRDICDQLCITLVAEGVEKAEEYRWLREAGISFFQGFYFAEPAFETLAGVGPDLY